MASGVPGLPHEPKILSAAEQRLFLSRVLHRLPLQHYAASTGLQLQAVSGKAAAGARVMLPSAGNADTRRFVNGLLSFFGRLQERGVSAHAYTDFVQSWGAGLPPDHGPAAAEPRATARQLAERERWERAEELAGCYALYTALKREQGMADMGDLIMQLHALL